MTDPNNVKIREVADTLLVRDYLILGDDAVIKTYDGDVIIDEDGIGGVDVEFKDVTITGDTDIGDTSADTLTITATIDDTVTITNAGASPEMIIGTTRATAEGATLQLYQNSASPAVDDEVGIIEFIGKDDGGAVSEYSKITGIIEDATAGAEFGSVSFSAMNGTGSLVEAAIIEHDGSNGIINAGDAAAAGVFQSSGDFDVILRTGNSTTGTFTITDGADADMTFATNGTGSVIVDQDGDGIGLDIDSEATTVNSYGLNVVTGQGARAAKLTADASVNTYLAMDNAYVGGSNHFKRDLAAANTGGPVVFIEQDNAGDDQNALNVQQDGTGKGQFIDQNGDAIGLDIDSEATTLTNYGLQVITGQGAIAGYFATSANEFARLGQPNNANGSNQFYRDLAAAATGGPVAYFTNDNAGDDQNVITLKQDGTGRGLFIDQNGDADGLFIDTEATTAASYGLRIEATQGAHPCWIGTGSNDFYIKEKSGGAASNYFYRNEVAATTAGPVILLVQDNAGDDQNALNIQNDGTGQGLFIDQNGDAIGLHIDTEATTAASYGLHVVAGQGASVARFEGANTLVANFADDNSSGSFFFNRNAASGLTSGPVMGIRNDNAGDDQPVLAIQQDVTTVEALNFSAGTIAINFATAMASTGAGTMAVNNSPGAGATTWIQVEINGTTAYIPAHYAA